MKKLKSRYVTYIGPIFDHNKKTILSKAKALLYPIDKDCHEMGNTTVIEAAFCGTPIITCNAGSMSEYINHGCSGFVCGNHDDFMQAISDIKRINPWDCYCWAKENFDQVIIARQYIDLVEEIRDGQYR